ncbi:carbohydrate-binding protein [Phytomonospora endophytica]|uniref:Protocatechuate 3,4-dioxygenase beta subunit n=1 Tax=Phytomonospora endophytica TaxID=714109 RepID=A0A841FTQ7_9ACTN|nr:carbohydrate-binding protein [Phytomonospora endophytica]MBB6035360.1 protocatechuate 3,4-dioxygenase beta subunit [Phytomonospora endophytica]GIG63888.1 dioxygenase [Phytomonospora endophytica]
MTGDNESPQDERSGVSRKTLLKAAMVALPAPLVLAAAPAFSGETTPSGQSLDPTPFCDDGDDPTPPQMEGPYFKPNSPQRTSMLDGAGTRLTLTGSVYGLGCQGIAGALLDFWQADNAGNYDNYTYRFRGHQFSDANGRFTLTTIVPGLYPGRTRHIHVKVQAPGRPILTTQLYFPNEPRNATDSLFDPRLLMNVTTGGGGRVAAFDFVLNVPQGPGPSPTTPTTSPTGSPGGTWRAGTAYNVGDRVTYGGSTYVCQIAHTAITGWEPPTTPALWRRV